jgi:molybdopterin-guanine dinucleotide biosynthesis protein B
VLVASSRRFALVHELRGEAEPPLAALLGKLAPVDLVLIEGYKREPHPKLEVHRAAVGMPLLALADPAIVAIASDVALPAAPVLVLDLNDVEGIVEILISSAVPLTEALARAGVA